MGENSNIYGHARAAVQSWWDHHNTDRPMEEMMAELTLAAVTATLEHGKPRVSVRGMAAFERLVALLPHDSYDVDLVRLELIGSAPQRDDKLPDELRSMLGVMRGDRVLEVLRKHNWGPLMRPRGRRRVAPSKLGYCPKHGVASELRQYSNGKTRPSMTWRCVLCMNDNRQRSRGKIIVDTDTRKR